MVEYVKYNDDKINMANIDSSMNMARIFYYVGIVFYFAHTICQLYDFNFDILDYMINIVLGVLYFRLSFKYHKVLYKYIKLKEK